MKRQGVPVILPDGSAFLEDGTHVTAAAREKAVETVTALCALLESLPLEVRVVLSLEAAFAELDGS